MIRPISTNIFIYNKKGITNRNNTTALPNITRSNECDTISFQARKPKVVTDLRKIPGVTCACCGDETILNGEIDKFINSELLYPANEALNILRLGGYFRSKNTPKEDMKAYNLCKLYTILVPDEPLPMVLDKTPIKALIQLQPNKVKKSILKIREMSKNIYHDAEYMVNALEKFTPQMHKTEKDVFEILKDESKRQPQKTFTEILSNPRVKDYHLKKLEKEQKSVFKDVEYIASQMSPESLKTILRTIAKSKAIFDSPNSKIVNKRSTVIESFKLLQESIPEQDLYQQIMSRIYELPSSKNNASSFIIKYASHTPNEIAEQILRGSESTHEHVKPKRRVDDNGENANSNYIVLCRNCNSERGQMPYSDFIKIHPQMPENMQKYMNIVIHSINIGQLLGFDQYPWQIKSAVEKESDGKIQINLKDLDLIEAEKNRKRIKK